MRHLLLLLTFCLAALGCAPDCPPDDTTRVCPDISAGQISVVWPDDACGDLLYGEESFIVTPTDAELCPVRHVYYDPIDCSVSIETECYGPYEGDFVEWTGRGYLQADGTYQLYLRRRTVLDGEFCSVDTEAVADPTASAHNPTPSSDTRLIDQR